MSELETGEVAPELRTRPEGFAGRADLLRAWLEGGEGELERLAERLGYERLPEERKKELPPAGASDQEPASAEHRPRLEPTPAPTSWKPIPFWRVTAVDWLEKIGDQAKEGASERDEDDVAELLVESDFEPAPLREGETIPEPLPIVAWPRLRRRLDDELRTLQRRREIDTDRLVQAWSRGEVLRRLPRRRGLFHERVALILDPSLRLAPFWSDQTQLVAALVRWLGIDRLRLLPPPDGAVRGVPVVERGEVVLALSDLGLYAGPGSRAAWERYGRALRTRGARLRALVPCPARWWPSGLPELWGAIDWSEPERVVRRGAVAGSVLEAASETEAVEAEEAAASAAAAAPAGMASPAGGSAMGLEGSSGATPGLDLDSATSAGEPTAEARAVGIPGAGPRALALLLAALSPALRVEPELLREIRVALGRAAPNLTIDLAAEVAVWIHTHVTGADSGVISVAPEHSAAWQRRFADLEPRVKNAVARAILRWHRFLPPEILHVEVAQLRAGGVPVEVLGEEAVGASEAWFHRAARTLEELAPQGSAVGAGLDGYARRGLRRAPEALASLPGYRPALARAVRLLRQRHADFPLPAGATPEMLTGPEPPPPPRRFTLWQEPGALRVRPFGTKGAGSWLTDFTARRPLLSIGPTDQPLQDLDLDAPDLSLPWPASVETLTLVTDVHRLELTTSARPDWATAAGRDRYGLWAAFEVEGVEQRLRWIPPGRFWMGSPEGEAGRFDNEGPRHLVELTDGLWLAETPCTQALWVAVMGEGENPSRFKSPRRPVEKVSWDDCRGFFEKLEEKDQRLRGSLPTEAEWEYACRAGTEAATWVGDLEILGANNAPLLDDIAWYGGNSGEDYDLDEWEDSSKWTNKQYDHTKAGSREVGRKERNPWGLYDMLGNVWEWCADSRRTYSEEPVTNPMGPEEGSFRVYRGGSWFSGARSVRAAYRIWFHPGARDDYLGFRLALGQGRGAFLAEPGVGSGRPPGVGRARDEPEPPGAAPDGGRR